MQSDGVEITARGITARGPLGPVFENVDADIRPGDLATITGPSGTGRTSLLLALSGRLRLVAGRLAVGGYSLPRQAKRVRTIMAPARVRPGFELEPRWRVREVAAERRATTGISATEISDSFDLVGIDPEPEAFVWTLHPGEQLLLAVALGIAPMPAGLLVDDVDLGLPEAARTRVWAALHAVVATGMTVLATSPDPPRFDAGPIIRLPFPEPPEEAGPATRIETLTTIEESAKTIELDTEERAEESPPPADGEPPRESVTDASDVAESTDELARPSVEEGTESATGEGAADDKPTESPEDGDDR